jgi:hypothetical protein
MHSEWESVPRMYLGSRKQVAALLIECCLVSQAASLCPAHLITRIMLPCMHQAMDFIWRKEATRIVFHICDAPCHGSEFHKPTWGTDWDEPGSYPPAGRETSAVEVKRALEYLMVHQEVHRCRTQLNQAMWAVSNFPKWRHCQETLCLFQHIRVLLTQMHRT